MLIITQRRFRGTRESILCSGVITNDHMFPSVTLGFDVSAQRTEVSEHLQDPCPLVAQAFIRMGHLNSCLPSI